MGGHGHVFYGGASVFWLLVMGLQLVPLLPLCRFLFTLLSLRNLPPLLYMSIQHHLEFDLRTKLAISYSFFNPFVFPLLLPSHPLNFFFPSDILPLFHVAILSTFSKTLHFFHTGIFILLLFFI